MTRRFLITGCGRSGTGYIATLLGELGIPCGHEVLYQPETCIERAPEWSESVVGESSWLAAPYLATLAEGTLVLHQVREPVAVVRSFLRIRFFEGKSVWKRFAEAHVAELASGTPLERCVKYWLGWNQLCQAASGMRHVEYRRHRLEDIDVDFLDELCSTLGEPRERATIVAALDRIPRDTNTSGAKHQDGSLRWSNLPRGEWGAELEDLAGRYGYAGELPDGGLRSQPRPRAALPSHPSSPAQPASLIHPASPTHSASPMLPAPPIHAAPLTHRAPPTHPAPPGHAS
ncbi:MAG: hypothetical protein HZA52_13570 [Planctomycetes bacterium]|nr:hypothetical protein [Planctomycetota bacterium]